MPDFKCVICQAECATAPADGGWTFCETCCPDHDYEYDPHDRQHHCVNCGGQRPDDWYDDEDAVPISFMEPGRQIGTPLSQMTAAEFQRIAQSWGYP